MYQWLLDPEADAVAGGGGGPAVKKDGDDDDGKLTDDQLTQVVGAMRSAFGLKEGQSIPEMITGAAKRTVYDSLGIEQGKDPKTHFEDIAKGVVGEVKPKEEPKKIEGDQADLQAQLSAVKNSLNSMHEESEQAKTNLHKERRKGAIVEALGQFKLRDDVKSLVTNGFIEGYEGPRVEFDEAGKLVVPAENGHSQPFQNHLDEYFEKNRGLLESKSFNGSGVRKTKANSSGGTGWNPNDDGARNKGNWEQQYKEDPEGTLRSIEEANAVKRKKLFG